MATYICMAESLCCLPEAITTLFVNWLYHNTKLKSVKKKSNIGQTMQYEFVHMNLFFNNERFWFFFFFFFCSAGSQLLSSVFFPNCSKLGLLSSCGTHVLIAEASLIAEYDLWDRRLQWLQHTSSVVVAHRFNCPVACGIFLGQRSNPCPLHCMLSCLSCV